jgi:hypothetical protein
MANLDDTGIQSIGTALVDTFEVERQIKVSDPVTDSDGSFYTAQGYDPTHTFSAKGMGDIPIAFALGGAGPAIAGITGGVSIITDLEEGNKNDGNNNWGMGGQHFPGAA